MSSNKQWDISKALATASLFHFFHSAGRFCVIPFLTIYFRQLGLSAPLVGSVIGLRYLIYVVWAPLSSFLAKSHRKRRVLIMGSLLLSAGAGVVFSFYPQLDKNIAFMYCNASLPWKNRLSTPVDFPSTTVVPSARSVGESIKAISATEFPSSLTVTLENPASRYGEESPLSPTGSVELQSEGSMGLEKTSAVTRTNLVSVLGSSSKRSSYTLSTVHHNSTPSRKRKETDSGFSDHVYFLDAEHKIFLVVLGLVSVWEISAAPLEWTCDESLYEYLDFVDATDRHGKLWIWGYLGASLGVSFISFLVDNLSCLVNFDIPKVSFHFYCYSGFMIATLLPSALYPIHVSKKAEHTNKTIKALGLIGTDGRFILLVVTILIMGAVGSTANNFLFWQMQDLGSSELYMGLSVAVAFLSELTLYFFKNKIMKAVPFKWLVTLGLLCLAVQLLYYSFLWTSWAILPIQLLSSFSGGAFWWAVNSQVDDIASPGTERSLQLVLRWLTYGFGASIGSFASGFIISTFSLAVLYQACCVTLLVWMIVFLLVQPKLPHTKKINYSRLLAADNSDMSDSDEEQERDWLVKAMKDENSNRKW